MTIAAVVIAAAITWGPGLFVLAPARLPVLVLTALAPATTLFVTYLGVSTASVVGVRWSISWMVLTTLVVAGGVILLTRLHPMARSDAPLSITLPGATAIALMIIAAAAWGAVIYWRASRSLSVIPQDFDWTFHANAIRWIGDTGDGTPDALRGVNAYESTGSYYYPSTFHALMALTYQVAGGDVVRTMHAHILMWMLVLPLGAAALVRGLGAGVVGVGIAALLANAFTSLPFDPLWRGLVPYLETLVVVPAMLAALVIAARRRHLLDGLIVATAVIGVVTTHTSAVATLAVFGTPVLVALVIASSDRKRLLMWGLGVGAMLVFLLVPTAIGLVASHGEGALTHEWPAVLKPKDGVRTGLLFGSGYRQTVQTVLALVVWSGAFACVLRRYRVGLGVVAGTAISVGLYVLAVSYDTPIAETLTAPWWNDQLRLSGLAAVCAPALAGIGIDAAASLRRIIQMHVPVPTESWSVVGRTVAAAGAAALAIALVLGVVIGRYAGANRNALLFKYGDGPAVTPNERAGMRVLHDLVPRGTRVMNDFRDGSAWMYALEGIKPVFGHIMIDSSMPAQELLDARFDEIASNDAVRVTAARLRIEYVWVSEGFVLEGMQRAAGLDHLAGQPDIFEPVYENPGVAIYRLNWPNVLATTRSEHAAARPGS